MASSDTIFPLTEYIITRPQPVLGAKYRGAGFYGKSGGLHTVQWSLYNFVGSIGLQASVELNPTSTDWFLISFGDFENGVMNDTPKLYEYLTSTTEVYSRNFSGNFIWIRAFITNWTQGNVNSIIMAH